MPATVGPVYRVLRRPRWILLTLTTLVLMVVMVNLSLWQLRRLHERRTANREVSTRTALPPAALDDVLPPTVTLAGGIGAAQWRRVEATGTYDGAHQVLVNDRSFDGLPGLHVVTPLVLADGRALLVNRGWVPIAPAAGADPVVPEAPAGAVTVIGRLRPTQTRGLLGPRDPATGTLTRLARLDVARIGQQVPNPLVPAYIELAGPDDGSLPRPLPLPALDEGPHLSYAGQWLLFTVLAGGGWVALVRRHAKLVRQQDRRAELTAERTAAAQATTTVASAGTATATAIGGAPMVTSAAPVTGAGRATTNGDRPPPADDAATTERPGTAEP